MRGDPDATLRARPARRAKRRRKLTLGALLLAGGLAAGGYFVTRPPEARLVAVSALPATPASAPVPPAPLPPAPPILQTEEEILARAPATLEIYRFAPQPGIMVLQFPSLAEQARTLNRVAALIEKAGFPHDRVLPDADLEQLIRAGGEEPDTFYLGHDYRAADVLRFFAAADQAGIALTPQEIGLRRTLADWQWRPGTNAALISLVREDPAHGLDGAARAAILRHELSHGAYFTEPGYAGFAHRFWTDIMTRNEHASFRIFLAGEGYDTSLDDLVINETQAYLVHTNDRRFFEPGKVALTWERWQSLRAAFVAGMPPGWLRDHTPAAAPALP